MCISFTYRKCHCESSVLLFKGTCSKSSKMSEDSLKFLLVASWSNDPDAICIWPCASPEQAISSLREIAPYSRHTLHAALVSNEKNGALAFFWTRFEHFAFDRPNWFRFSTGIKAFLSMECTNETKVLDIAWERISAVVPCIYEPLNFHLTAGEKLSLRSQAGIIPKWVQSAEAYVLWAINGINENTICTSKRIINHPANAGLYVKSTVYNALATLRDKELVAEEWIESLRVYVLTRQGQSVLATMEEDYADSHPRRSARSLRISA